LKVSATATRATLAALISLSLLSASCGEEKTTTQKLAIYSAQAESGLVAVTDSIAKLNEVGRIANPAAKGVYQALLKVATAVDLVRERAKAGYQQKDTLSIISAAIDDIRAAEAQGVLPLAGRDRDQFLKVTFFAQFSLKSLQAVIEAIKEPALPASEVAQAANPKALTKAAADDATVWTDLVLILQTAVLKGISQSRLSADEAFADGAAISAQLKDSLTAKIAAL
jgi:hypothetical protein